MLEAAHPIDIPSESIDVAQASMDRLNVGEDALPVGLAHNDHVFDVQQWRDPGLFTAEQGCDIISG